MKLTEGSCFKRTICEVHRELWDFIEDMPPSPLRDQLESRIREAYYMAKRMDKKLREYKEEWFRGFYEDNEDWEQDKERRRKRRQENAKPAEEPTSTV